MNPTTNRKLVDLMESFNTKQKQIASKLIVDKNYHFLENDNQLLIKDSKSGQMYDFVDYVKSKCNCG